MHTNDRISEMEAFVKSALLYQPMNDQMASRFTGASGVPIPSENAGKKGTVAGPSFAPVSQHHLSLNRSRSKPDASNLH